MKISFQKITQLRGKSFLPKFLHFQVIISSCLVINILAQALFHKVLSQVPIPKVVNELHLSFR